MIDTGQLRSLLQPVVFARLTEPQGNIDAGEMVALQYWGNGKVTITRFPDGYRETNVAHSIKVDAIERWIDHSDGR